MSKIHLQLPSITDNIYILPPTLAGYMPLILESNHIEAVLITKIKLPVNEPLLIGVQKVLLENKFNPTNLNKTFLLSITYQGSDMEINNAVRLPREKFYALGKNNPLTRNIKIYEVINNAI